MKAYVLITERKVLMGSAPLKAEAFFPENEEDIPTELPNGALAIIVYEVPHQNPEEADLTNGSVYQLGGYHAAFSGWQKHVSVGDFDGICSLVNEDNIAYGWYQ